MLKPFKNVENEACRRTVRLGSNYVSELLNQVKCKEKVIYMLNAP